LFANDTLLGERSVVCRQVNMPQPPQHPPIEPDSGPVENGS
jgi:hypothetical protein